MNTRSQLWKKYLAFLCAALILVCALLLLSLHVHEHTADTNCAICDVIDLWRYLLLGTLLFAAFGVFVSAVPKKLGEYVYVVTSDETTLVGQKVKLSN